MAPARKKACDECSSAKVRCDHKPTRCSRCQERGLACRYPAGRRHSHDKISGSSTLQFLQQPVNEFVSLLSPPTELVPFTQASPLSGGNSRPACEHICVGKGTKVSQTGTKDYVQSTDVLDFTHLELVCTIDVNAIRNHWLNEYVPTPEQCIKNYPPSITSLLFRTLKSYTSMTIHTGRQPPFIHQHQLGPHGITPPLSRCITLLRLCDGPMPGSEELARDTIEREMRDLYAQYQSFDHKTMQAAFQAYLTYIMALFFHLGQHENAALQQYMANLQDIASATCSHGVVARAEIDRTRPILEEWLTAEAKRRTLYVMYLFDSVVRAQHRLPTYFATETRYLLAPGSKDLWQTTSRLHWENTYNTHISRWPDGFLTIGELWPIPLDFDAAQVSNRRRRVDKWLEDVDEYGMMFYAVTMCTHGG